MGHPVGAGDAILRASKNGGYAVEVFVELPKPVGIGVLYAEGVRPDAELLELERRLETLLARVRSGSLEPELEARRRSVRDLLRYGRYKPTGRAKPASEYLLREAQEGRFPRINTVVDISNYLSLKHLLPISLWDVDKAGTSAYRFRVGHSGERYVFNASGQTLELEDLLVGCALVGQQERPIVSPVKDALATKIEPGTRRVAAAVYAPSEARSSVEALLEEFAELLLRTAPEARLRHRACYGLS